MEQATTGKNGVRLRRLNTVMVIAAGVLAVALMLAAIYSLQGFRSMQEATGEYIQARQDAAEMQEASDYLTDRVRTFVVAGDPVCVADFFEEVEVTQQRDRALADMKDLLSGTETTQYLAEAMRLSNELVGIEHYAMRLAIEGYGYAVSDFPAALQTVVLSEEDLSKTPEEQLARARMLVFDETYRAYKSEIHANVAKSEAALTEKTERRQVESSDRLGGVLIFQEVLIGLMLVILFAVVYCTHRMIIRPIESVVSAISEEQHVPEKGSFELRFLAQAYNRVFEQTRRNSEQLSYEASHDQLTGLYNRSVFEKLRTEDEPDRTMLLIDVDDFKSFNDTYGHETGDRVLQKVAQTVQANFRSEDFVCRIGGDEFAVVMVHTNNGMRELIEGKLRRVAQRLCDTTDGLPKVTLSIGVALGDRPTPTADWYKDADAALYVVKDRGRNGFAFYGDAEQKGIAP